MERKKHISIPFPNDIIFHILQKLPGKSLVRFKCVCKLWRSFITDLKYVKHLLIFSSSYSVQSVDFQASNIKPVSLEYPTKPPHFFKIIGSCSGLLCIYGYYELILWNPCTEGFTVVPISQIWYYSQCGLGYDHYTNDYKIVRLYNGLLYNETMFQIYSLNTNSWEEGKLPWQIEFDKIHWGTFGTSVNGALHWPIISTEIPEFGAILRLDLKNQNQKFSLINLPDEVGKVPIFELLDYGGRLCMVHYHYARYIDMWVMDNCEDQNWIKLMSIPGLDELQFDGYPSPDFVFMNGEVLMNVRRMHPNRQRTNEFCLYNPKEKTFKKFEIQCSKRFYQVISYTQSLISPIQFVHDGGKDKLREALHFLSNIFLLKREEEEVAADILPKSV